MDSACREVLGNENYCANRASAPCVLHTTHEEASLSATAATPEDYKVLSNLVDIEIHVRLAMLAHARMIALWMKICVIGTVGWKSGLCSGKGEKPRAARWSSLVLHCRNRIVSPEPNISALTSWRYLRSIQHRRGLHG